MEVVSILVCTEGARPPASDVIESFDVPPGTLEEPAGGDVLEVGGVPIQGRCTAETNDLSLRPAAFDACVSNGIKFLEFANREGRDPGRGMFPWIVQCFPASLRLPLICQGLDRIQSQAGLEALNRVLGAAAQGRGRPSRCAQLMMAACALDQLVPKHGSRAAAARALGEIFPAVRSYSDPRSLENLRSRLGPLPRLYAEGYFIPGRHLDPRPWGAVSRPMKGYLVRSRITTTTK